MTGLSTAPVWWSERDGPHTDLPSWSCQPRARIERKPGTLTGTRTTTKPALTSIAAVESRPETDMVRSGSGSATLPSPPRTAQRAHPGQMSTRARVNNEKSREQKSQITVTLRKSSSSQNRQVQFIAKRNLYSRAAT